MDTHGIHPRSLMHQVQAPGLSSPAWRVPDVSPACNMTDRRCEVWVPSAAFGLPTDNEKIFAAKQFGRQRQEDGWHWVKDEAAAKPGWIVVRRKITPDPLVRVDEIQPFVPQV